MKIVLAALALASSPALAARIDLGPYLQNARPDGATVIWETDAATDGAVVVGERRFPSPAGTHHEVRVTGLSPGRHAYHVEAGGAVSAESSLATAVSGDTFTFLVYGDNRDRDYEHGQVVAAMAGEHADFVINTGDLTGDAGIEALWRRFFAIEQPLLSSVPLYPAIGNHELLHDPGLEHYHRFFAPPDLPAGHPDSERYYSFRYGNALFVALDGNQSHSTEQAAWLRRTLDATTGDATLRHLFVFFHQPPFSVGDICGSAAEQGLWVPELEQRGVRAVFTGHDHSYQHLERNGVRYFVTGGGGAPLHHESARCPEYDRHARRLFRSTYHYLRVRIRGDLAVLDALTPDGQLIETVALHQPTTTPPTPAPPVPYQRAPVAAVAARSPLLGFPIAILAAGTLALAVGWRRRARR